jgi:hypothetical protein
MKLSNINIRNIKAFLQGESRLMLEFFDSLPEHIQEQVRFRIHLVSDKSPQCLEGKCIHCGCSTPDLFYADKTCDNQCYPEMLNKEQWENFKFKNNII